MYYHTTNIQTGLEDINTEMKESLWSSGLASRDWQNVLDHLK